jgi:hypothetical protein
LRRRDLILGSLATTLTTSLDLRSANLSFTSLEAENSPPLRGVSVESPIPVADSDGDTWVSTWADNGHLYSPSNDTSGFHSAPKGNIAFNRIDGNSPLHLDGETINPMAPYGKDGAKGRDGCTWKSSGCACIDGVLYWVIARHQYGEESGDPHRRQTAQNASISSNSAAMAQHHRTSEIMSTRFPTMDFGIVAMT